MAHSGSGGRRIGVSTRLTIGLVYPVGLEVVYVNTPVSTSEEGIASKKASYSLKFIRSKISSN